MEILQSKISHFEASLAQAIELFKQQVDMPAYLNEIAEGAQLLAKEICALGDHAFQMLEKERNYAYYRIDFEWADKAKAFLILWRDVQLEQEKAQVMLWDGKTDELSVKRLQEASYTSIAQAASDLIAKLKGDDQGDETQRLRQEEKQIEKWKHQKNPWPTYKEQILLLPVQCKDVQEQYIMLLDVVDVFQQIRAEIKGLSSQSVAENDGFVIRAMETVELIGTFLPEEGELRPGRIAARLEDMGELLDLPNYLDELNRNIEGLLEKLPEKMRIPFATNSGLIQYKDLSLRKNVSQWLEAKIMPVIFEIWEIAEQERNSLKTTLLNIRNRTSVLSAEVKEGKKIQITAQDVCRPLDNFLENAAQWKDEMLVQQKTITRRLKRDFILSAIYHTDEEFLDLPFQATIRYFTPDQNRFRMRFSSSWMRIKGFFLQIIQRVVDEENLSSSEKLVSFIQNRRPDVIHSNYTSIFLTKGYIGESFWVGREKELTHMEQLINNWDRGVRGAVVLYGQRFSGKSLFGELVANRFFPKRTIRLLPHATIKLGGRQLTTTHNLGEALDFIRKYSLNTRPLIWIDDLEMWRDPQIPLSQNIRSLQQHLDNHADDQFFILGMNTWLKNHLDKEHHFDQVVHSAIKLDKMLLNEVMQAIWIRHSATNKALVDDNGADILPAQFRKMVNHIFKISKGNIGETLNRWAYSITSEDDDKVVFNAPARANMPDFLTPDSILMLNTFMIMKRTNEYQLRKIFGPPFKTKYGNLLNQLMSVGLIQRQVDGWLEVNELVVNDLSRMMELKGKVRTS